MKFYATTAQGCCKISMQKLRLLDLFLEHLSTEKILCFRMCHTLHQISQSYREVCEKVGQKASNKQGPGSVRSPFSVSVSAISKYNFTTNISDKLKENLGDRTGPFPPFFLFLFQFCSSLLQLSKQTQLPSQKTFSCNLAQPVRAFSQLRDSF